MRNMIFFTQFSSDSLRKGIITGAGGTAQWAEFIGSTHKALSSTPSTV